MLTSTGAFADKRRLKRHKLSAEILIFDELNHINIGKLIDIHQEGILLIGKELSLDSTHQITVNLPNSVNLKRQFSIGIECLWSQPADPESALFWSGCSIIDKSDLASGCIESLVNMKS